jgi:peptidyl-prolyl cis-trans isomerase SurA
MVTKYSNDRATVGVGGKLPEFGTGVYESAFEQPIFALKTTGAITEPFLTSSGYHIVRRDSVAPPYKTMDDPFAKFWIEQKLQKSDRLQEEKDRYRKEIATKVDFKKTSTKSFDAIIEEAKALFNNSNKGEVPVYEVGKFKNGKSTSFKDFYFFYGSNADANGTQQANAVVWANFIESQSVEHYKQHLEDYNTEFYYQIREFRDGNLLFEIMEQNVWGQAGKDENALKDFYNKNPAAYVWNKSADVEIYNCADKKVAEEALQKAKQGISYIEIANESKGEVQADSGRYELTQIMSEEYRKDPKENGYSAIVNNKDQTFAFVHYIKLYPAGERRKFSDARGEVVSNYQDLLEEQWLKKVEAKYPIKVNEAVLKSVMK